MSFIQFCVRHVDYLCEAAWPSWAKCQLPSSEHCLSVWRNAPLENRTQTPEPGCIIIWQHGETEQGHTGIVERVFSNGKLGVIEGNTNADEVVNREGDGVYRKVRDTNAAGPMKVVGYLLPWV